MIEDEFIMFHAVFCSHLAKELIFMPKAQLDDETIYLCFVRASAGKVNMIKILKGLETGRHVTNDHFEVRGDNF